MNGFSKILLIYTILMNPLSFASPNMANYFKAMVDSEVFQQVSEIENQKGFLLKKIEHTQTNRCLGCYEFTVTYESNEGSTESKTREFSTYFDFESNLLHVKLR